MAESSGPVVRSLNGGSSFGQILERAPLATRDASPDNRLRIPTPIAGPQNAPKDSDYRLELLVGRPRRLADPPSHAVGSRFPLLPPGPQVTQSKRTMQRGMD